MITTWQEKLIRILVVDNLVEQKIFFKSYKNLF